VAPTAIVVAGPGVLPDGVDAVRRFAARTRVGVLNTYGVKGLFRWDDPAHLGTIGLQADDVELAGVLDAEVVLAVGLDERELALADLGARAEVVAPADLDDWADRVEPAPPGALYGALRGALLPLYDSEAVPLTPAAAAADLGAALPEGALVCADPGPVGFWIARTLPTTQLGSVYVPPVDDPALALDRARAAAADGRPVVYVTHRAEVGHEAFVVEAWVAEARLGSRQERRDRLVAALAAGGGHRFATPVDLTLTSVLTDVAGPITAWR
jgi:hypothetical protein